MDLRGIARPPTVCIVVTLKVLSSATVKPAVRLRLLANARRRKTAVLKCRNPRLQHRSVQHDNFTYCAEVPLRNCSVGHFKCTECGKSFVNRSTLSIHKLGHTGEQLYSCCQCGKQFAYEFHLTLYWLTPVVLMLML